MGIIGEVPILRDLGRLVKHAPTLTHYRVIPFVISFCYITYRGVILIRSSIDPNSAEFGANVDFG